MAKSAVLACGMGGFKKCCIGSETPKYNKPIPIPAENNIENQENKLNSVTAFSPPIFTFPY